MKQLTGWDQPSPAKSKGKIILKEKGKKKREREESVKIEPSSGKIGDACTASLLANQMSAWGVPADLVREKTGSQSEKSLDRLFAFNSLNPLGLIPSKNGTTTAESH